MIKCRIICYLFCCLLLSTASHAEEPFREFSNPEGATIKARPIGIYGDKVRLEFADQREMNVALDFFSKKDAAFLKQWAIVFLSSQERLLEVDVQRKKVVTADYKRDVKLTDGSVVEDALEIREIDGFYEITLENRSDFDLSSIVVEYRVFSEQDHRGKVDRDDVNYIRAVGSLSYKLAPDAVLTQSTKPVKLEETELGKGITWSGGGELSTDAKLIGIWFRIYSDDSMLLEFAQPSTLPKREQWAAGKK